MYICVCVSVCVSEFVCGGSEGCSAGDSNGVSGLASGISMSIMCKQGLGKCLASTEEKVLAKGVTAPGGLPDPLADRLPSGMPP